MVRGGDTEVESATEVLGEWPKVMTRETADVLNTESELDTSW